MGSWDEFNFSQRYGLVCGVYELCSSFDGENEIELSEKDLASKLSNMSTIELSKELISQERLYGNVLEMSNGAYKRVGKYIAILKSIQGI